MQKKLNKIVRKLVLTYVTMQLSIISMGPILLQYVPQIHIISLLLDSLQKVNIHCVAEAFVLGRAI
jgi:hypothetical protein